jgi:hypothetical protein
MEIFRKILLYLNLLSLDVVFGAMAGMVFFSDLLEVNIAACVYFLLGLAVWSIYTLDHLMDARGAIGKPQSPRHQFHQKYHRLLFPLAICSVLTGAILFFTLTEMEFIRPRGIGLGIVTVFWMGFLKIAGPTYSWLKEISTALIYVLGISLAPFATVDFELIDITIYVFAFVYFLAALVNLLMLSYQDAEVDKKDGFGSVLVLIPKTGLKNLILVFGLTGIGFLIVLAAISPSYYHVESVILGLIIGYHLILFFSKNQTKDQVRRKSEALFLLPFLLLLF